MRRAVHDGGIKFDDAFFVRQAAVSDSQLVRVVFDGRDAVDDGFERVGAGLHLLYGELAGFEGVRGADAENHGESCPVSAAQGRLAPAAHASRRCITAGGPVLWTSASQLP